MTITQNHTITYTHEDGWSIELPEVPLDHLPGRYFVLPNDGVVVDDNEVRFIVDDDRMGYDNFDDFYGNDQFIEFRDFSIQGMMGQAEFIDAFNDLNERGYKVFLVGKYEHGLVSYSLHHEAAHPDMRWDYGIVGLIGVTQDEFIASVESPEESARNYLKDYTDWCNGFIYSVVTVPRDRPEEYERCGGFFGESAIDAVLLGQF
jgi:hypothetical protein